MGMKKDFVTFNCLGKFAFILVDLTLDCLLTHATVVYVCIIILFVFHLFLELQTVFGDCSVCDTSNREQSNHSLDRLPTATWRLSYCSPTYAPSWKVIKGRTGVCDETITENVHPGKVDCASYTPSGDLRDGELSAKHRLRRKTLDSCSFISLPWTIIHDSLCARDCIDCTWPAGKETEVILWHPPMYVSACLPCERE